ncbi:MAG: peptidase dimerization domain protein, partial [Flavobacteriaceae bacterium]|nr:peptidase dimerization domain protein [Flavobacteriaceae bacterium]
MNSITSYVSKNRDRMLNELLDLLKIPSISADSAYKNDVIKTAETIKDHLKKA